MPGFWERFFYNTKLQIVLVLFLCAFIGIGTPFIWHLIWRISQDCCHIESDLRYDCYPLQDMVDKNKSFCEKRAHCCWDNDTTPDQIQCYYGIVTEDVSTKMPGYSVYNSSEELNVQTVVLHMDKVPSYIDSNNTDSTIGPVVRHNLTLKVEHFFNDHFRVKISSEEDEGYNLENEFEQGFKFKSLIQPNNSDAEVSWKSKLNHSMFSLTVRRKKSRHLIFNTGSFSPFIYSKGFIEITTLLPNDLIYGLGQSPSKGFKHNMTYPENWQIFNKYNLNLTTNQSSWFGSHPFYMGWTNDDKAYGVLLLNSYPIQLITNSRPSLTFRTIGGPLDFHFFLGPTPKDVYKQLIRVIGKPSLPPYWALGFHMCRTNNDLKDPEYGAETIVRKMREFEIPFDSDCGSAALSSNLIKSEQGEKESYALLQEYYDKVLNEELQINALVVTVPHKASGDSNWKNLGVLKRPDGMPYEGRFYNWLVMNSDPKNANITVIYPSFENNFSVRMEVRKEYKKYGDVSGTFLDFNTPLDLSSTRGLNMSVLCSTLIENNKWNQFYYWKLNEYNPCLDSVNPSMNADPLSTHNLYGHRHMKTTKKALEELSGTPRKLVMSLSTFIGGGAFGGHIGTNMNGTWDMLFQTHLQTLEFNMYGIPLVGFPVCGFKGKSLDEELCLRWYQLAALQPFMVSHRGFGENLTDPLSVTKSKTTQEALKSSILIRYRLLPFMYTLFYRGHIEGEPVVRPLFYEFPNDKNTYRIDKQYLLGSALMVTPVIHKEVKYVEAYFPKDKEGTVWYDYYSGRRMAVKEGQKFNLSAIEYHINLHLRGGYVIPTQTPGNNTEESRKNAFQLIAALDLDRHAEGYLYIDDGKTVDSNQYMVPNFTVRANNLTINTNRRSPGFKDLYNSRVDMIKIFGVIDTLSPEYFIVECCNLDQPCKQLQNHTKIDYIHDPYSGVLTLRNLTEVVFGDCDQFYMSWSYLDWNTINQRVNLNHINKT